MAATRTWREHTEIALREAGFRAGGARAAVLAGCGGDAGSDKRTVLAAFYPLAFAAEAVGGEAVDVTNLTPPGAEPHDLELTARDVGRVRDADTVIVLGGGFQPALEEAAANAEGTVVELLPTGERDPHVWLDPLRYAGIARRIARAVGRPAAAQPFVRRLETLHRRLRDGLANCERRRLVTSHAAFGHLAARYGLGQIAISGLSPDAEPTAGDLERVVDAVRAAGATTVFTETLVSRRVAETVAREAGAQTAVLDPLEGLEEGALERGADYFSVMRANLAALRRGLGCR